MSENDPGAWKHDEEIELVNGQLMQEMQEAAQQQDDDEEQDS